MKILITGGGGFIGSRLAHALQARHPDARIRLLDVGFPPGLPAAFECMTGDVASPEVIARALGGDTDTVFHLAAVVSGGAEADFDLGYRVNLDGTRLLLEACRRLKSPPRLVYSSSIAVFGGTLPEVLDDSTTPTPQISYGAQKVIGEYLVADYARKGFLDGRSLRLPTIVVRPGKPNLAATSFASGMFREPLNGVICECPVSDATGIWILSPRQAVEAFVHAYELPSSAWGPSRVVNLPGITVSVKEGVSALHRIGGDALASRVVFKPDARIQAIIKTLPVRFKTPRALAMGFAADPSIDAIIQDYIVTEHIKV